MKIAIQSGIDKITPFKGAHPQEQGNWNIYEVNDNEYTLLTTIPYTVTKKEIDEYLEAVNSSQ